MGPLLVFPLGILVGLLLGVPLGVLEGALLQFLRGLLQSQGFRRVVWVFLRVAIVIVVIIILPIIVLRHSCDATLLEGGSKIILVGKAVNEQWSIAIVWIPSVAHGKCLNALDDPGWHWGFSYLMLECNHGIHL